MKHVEIAAKDLKCPIGTIPLVDSVQEHAQKVGKDTGAAERWAVSPSSQVLALAGFRGSALDSRRIACSLGLETDAQPPGKLGKSSLAIRLALVRTTLSLIPFATQGQTNWTNSTTRLMRIKGAREVLVPPWKARIVPGDSPDYRENGG